MRGASNWRLTAWDSRSAACFCVSSSACCSCADAVKPAAASAAKAVAAAAAAPAIAVAAVPDSALLPTPLSHAHCLLHSCFKSHQLSVKQQRKINRECVQMSEDHSFRRYQYPYTYDLY